MRGCVSTSRHPHYGGAVALRIGNVTRPIGTGGIITGTGPELDVLDPQIDVLQWVPIPSPAISPARPRHVRQFDLIGGLARPAGIGVQSVQTGNAGGASYRGQG